MRQKHRLAMFLALVEGLASPIHLQAMQVYVVFKAWVHSAAERRSGLQSSCAHCLTKRYLQTPSDKPVQCVPAGV